MMADIVSSSRDSRGKRTTRRSSFRSEWKRKRTTLMLVPPWRMEESALLGPRAAVIETARIQFIPLQWSASASFTSRRSKRRLRAGLRSFLPAQGADLHAEPALRFGREAVSIASSTSSVAVAGRHADRLCPPGNWSARVRALAHCRPLCVEEVLCVPRASGRRRGALHFAESAQGQAGVIRNRFFLLKGANRDLVFNAPP